MIGTIRLDKVADCYESVGYLLLDFFLEGRPGFRTLILAKSDFLMR